jgi:uncharacterized protein (TIGR03000 family)
MRYSGGFIQTHRSPPDIPWQPTTPTTTPATPPAPPSYFPDNDFNFPPYYAVGEPERPVSAPAGVPPFGVSAAAFPWNQPGFVDYNESPQVPRDETVSSPKKYSLGITTLSRESSAARPDTAVLIARLPEQAAFWVEGTRTRSSGRMRYFQSPPLLPGRRYNYRVRVLWMENGQLVSQTRMVPVQAGAVQAIYLRLN